MKTKISNVKIRGIASAYPKNKIDLKTFGDIYGEHDVKRIMESTGIRSIRIAEEGLCTSDFCETAARELLFRLELKASDIDAIVFVSQTPDYILPATSVLLQQRLGLPEDAVCFDINYGCSGYIYGLYQASMLISSGGCKRVLLCAGDVISRLVHPNDRSVRMVFGDAGSATIVEEGECNMIFQIKTNGGGSQHLIVPAGGFRHPISEETKREATEDDGNTRTMENIYMNGMEIMKFAIKEVPALTNELLNYAGLTKEDVGLFGFHQANTFMIDYLKKKMKLPTDKVPIAVESIGNTGPASIPVMLTESNESLPLTNLDQVVLCGFGVGLSWGGVICDLSKTLIIPSIEVKKKEE